MKAVILAAGKGTRINTGSILVPKPLYAVGQRALIEHCLLNMKQGGIKDFVLIVGFMSEHVKDYLKDGTELGINIQYVYNPNFDKELGVSALTAKKAVPHENFILSMADHVHDPATIRALVAKLEKSDKCILCVDKKLDKINDIEDATKVLEEDGFILNINKKIEPYNCVDTGLFGMTPKLFSALEKAQSEGKNTLSDGMNELVKTKELIILDIGNKRWAEVDTRSDLIVCEELI